MLAAQGGVWADASTLCATPLDHWLAPYLSSGFFAFEKPAADRMIASWFLASVPGAYITTTWRDAVREYWRQRASRHDYFWFHQLFGALHHEDDQFRTLWDNTPKLPAAHAFHFAPEDDRLYAPPTSIHLQGLQSPPSPVFKLTHKLSMQTPAGSLIGQLCDFGRGRLP